MAGRAGRTGRLGDAPWPGTDALFWSRDRAVRAVGAGHRVTLAVRFEAAELDEPHDGASSPFNVSVVCEARAYADGDGRRGRRPGRRRHRPARPVSRHHRRGGRGAAHLAKGRYELVVWKAGYDAPATPLTIDADAAVQIDARALPEDDPDAVWTA